MGCKGKEEEDSDDDDLSDEEIKKASIFLKGNLLNLLLELRLKRHQISIN